MHVDDERFDELSKMLMNRFDNIDRKLDRMSNIKQALDGDKLLDNHDMCAFLGVTKRTLARYRQKKLVSYYLIDGRTYYKTSEIKDFLMQKGKSI